MRKQATHLAYSLHVFVCVLGDFRNKNQSLIDLVQKILANDLL